MKDNLFWRVSCENEKKCVYDEKEGLDLAGDAMALRDLINVGSDLLEFFSTVLTVCSSKQC